MNTHTFTVQQIDDILFDLYCEKNSLIKYLKELDDLILDNTQTQEQINELKEEKVQIIFDIHEISCDINMYNEMINSYYYSTTDTLYDHYDGACEVFASGEY
jgi:hypothetical protein